MFKSTLGKTVNAIDGFFGALGRFLTGQPISSAIKKAKYARQRVKRGWDDTATWSLDTHLARTLGAQLSHLAYVTHGYPSGGNFSTFEEWQEALRTHGQSLTLYAEGIHEYEDNIDHAKLIADAETALHWVADNFGSLWD
jgi:hypothetical protein